jgi:hypothetical protein
MIKEVMMKKTNSFSGIGVVIALVSISILVAGCSGGSITVENLTEKLAKLKTNTEDKPYTIRFDSSVNISTKMNDINKAVNSEGKYVILDFSNCGATNNTLSSNMNIIKDNTFIKGLILPKSITGIEDKVFENCKNLTSVTIPKDVTTIGNTVFSGCTALTGINIPSGVTTIGVNAFNYCYSLASITVDSGNGAYKSIDGVLFNKDATTLIKFPYGKGDSYVIPEGVTIIERDAFSYSITNLTIPSSVTKIGSGALSSSYATGSSLSRGLTSVTFSRGSNIDNFEGSWTLYDTHGGGPDFLKRAYEAETRPFSSNVTFVMDGLRKVRGDFGMTSDEAIWKKP